MDGGRRPSGLYIERAGGQKGMRDMFILYAFLGLMAFNVLASFAYAIGLEQLRATVRKASRAGRQPPR